MAGLRGNTAWLMAARQPAGKGTPATIATATTFKTPFSGGNIMPVRVLDQLAETDSQRDRGNDYMSTSGVEGSPECYGRDDIAGLFLYGVLGADAVTGTTNLTHTLTPASTLPYMTFWRSISDTLWERYEDCKVGSATFATEAGAPLTMALGVQGRKAVRLTTDPSTSPVIPLDTNRVYTYNDATVQLGGSATAVIRSFELGIENNISRQQTDDVVPYDVVEGIREINLSFDLIFETLDEYNKFHYATIVGTTVANSVYTTSADFQFDNGANNSIKFTLPSIAYEEFVVEPNTAGDPITVSVRAVGQRSGSPILTAVVKNQVTAY